MGLFSIAHLYIIVCFILDKIFILEWHRAQGSAGGVAVRSRDYSRGPASVWRIEDHLLVLYILGRLFIHSVYSASANTSL